MARLLLVFFIGLLLAGCDTDQVKFKERGTSLVKSPTIQEKLEIMKIYAKEIQQLAAKGYAPALLDSIMGQRFGYLPKNSKLIEANLLRLNELGYVDAKATVSLSILGRQRCATTQRR